jgi:hypothetical protein
VTQIDRDWGTGAGWCQEAVGFVSVAVMPPLLMAIAKEDGTRRHLVGAGIQLEANASFADCNAEQRSRMGLPIHVWNGLMELGDATPSEALKYLQSNGFAPIYDSGVERLIMTVPDSTAVQALQQKYQVEKIDEEMVRKIWDASIPKFPVEYYSPNPGIRLLLDHAKQSGGIVESTGMAI